MDFPFGFTTVARFIETANQVGALVRAVCMITMVACLWAGAADRWRIVQILPAVVGLALSWYESKSERLMRLQQRGGPLRLVGSHFLGHKETASATVSGLLEGVGIVGGALLFAGPWPVTLSGGLRTVALIGLTVYVWIAFGQIATDPGYYNSARPPGRALVAFRWVLPAFTASVAFLVFCGPSDPPPIRLGTAVALATLLLLLWPYMGVVDLLVRSAQSVAREWLSAVMFDERDNHAEAVHAAKGQMRVRQMLARSDVEHDAYSHALVAIEAARRQVLADRSAAGQTDAAFSELWATYASTLVDAAVRDRVQVRDRTGGRLMPLSTVQLILYALVDLVGNALRASTDGRVGVSVSLADRSPHTHWVGIVVEDRGAGYSPGAIAGDSSMGTLDRMCRYRGGQLSVGPSDGGGTRVEAAFISSISTVSTAVDITALGGTQP
ncbi:MAG TPA: hypothetical protein VGL39_28010 [Jatrophihabitantaceae bacterium]|jgi:hypothetical protein